MTTKMVEINCTTGEVTERAMTKSELDAEKKFQEDAKKINPNDLSQRPEAEAMKATAKAAAEGKLAALGLTTDDLRALGL